MGVPKLTQEQQTWLNEVTAPFRGSLIYMGFYGSHLYGLDREGSDIDIKAVYLPTPTEMLLGKKSSSTSKKNEELNIEVEFKPIGSFLNSAKACDTNVMDMLHTPEEFWIKSHYLWRELVYLRKDLYAKNMAGIVGYIKTHAAKYSHKIERLEELKALLGLTDSFENTDRIQTLCDVVDLSGFKYISAILFSGRQDMDEQPYLEVCSKKYITSWSIGELKVALNREIDRYGKRTKQGLDTGLDTKALSHSLRVLLQLKQLVEEGTMSFPIKEADYVLKVKTGVITDAEEIINKIDVLYEECMEGLRKSNFKEDPYVLGMVNEVLYYYNLQK